MVLKEITIGQSCQVIRMGQEEKWNKINTLAGIEEGETLEEVAFAVIEKVEAIHLKWAGEAATVVFDSPKIIVGGKPIGSIIDQVKSRLNGA